MRCAWAGMDPAKLKTTSSMKAAIRFIASVSKGRFCSDLTPRRHPVGTESVTSVIGLVAVALVDGLRLPRHVIHQQILAQRVRCGEVGLAAAHLGHFLDELY